MRILLYIFVLCIGFQSCKKLSVERLTKLTTDDISISNSDVIASGTIVDISAYGVEYYGHCWSKTPSPEAPIIANSIALHTTLDNPIAGNSFTSQLTNIEFNTTYFVRSYAYSSQQVSYGEEKTFSITDINGLTISCSIPNILDESSVEVSSTISGANSLSILDYGFCWGQSSSPTTQDFVNSNGSISNIGGDLTHNFTIGNLSQEVTYYIRAYVQLDNNTIIYSDQQSVLISDLNIITGTYSQNGNSVTIVGEITSLGIVPITDHGHCWSYANPSPTINDNILSKGPTSTVGIFYNTINLNPGNTATYYYRAYAIKNNTIVYGDVETFTL